ncbi:MAG: hypothetical protein ABW321_22780 [Polyangiales bacterium]
MTVVSSSSHSASAVVRSCRLAALADDNDAHFFGALSKTEQAACARC